MRNKRNQSEHIVVVADGEFAPPNLIRTNNNWMGVPVQWLHLVPNRHNLQRVKIVLHLHYRDGDTDEQEQAES
jgi:hypothetical protein